MMNRRSFVSGIVGGVGNRLSRLAGACGFVLLITLLSFTSVAQESIPMRHAWESDPDLGVVWLEKPDESVSANDTAYYLKLFSSSDTRDLIAAAQWFASVGRNLEPTDKAVVFKLVLPLLQRKELHRQLRQSLTSAAISVYSGDDSAARLLWDAAYQDPTILPTLEQWAIEQKLSFAAQLWKSRLTQPEVSEFDLSLALSGIEAMKLSDCADDLVKLILRESMTQPLLLQACGALGAVTSSGKVELAQRLRKSSFASRDLMAARVIANHSDEAAATLAGELLTSSFAPAKRLAYLWHVQHGSARIDELTVKFRTDADAALRRLAIEQLVKSDEVKFVELLGQSLSDENANNRRVVRQALIAKHANSTLTAAVDSLLKAALQPAFGPGSDQAIEVVVRIKSQQFNSQLIDLLDHGLPEVRVRAAWAIADLGFADSQQLQAVFNRCLKLTDEVAPPDGKTTTDKNAMLAFLLESLGKARHEPAKEMLIRYIAKAVLPALPRASGIWSLGLVLEGSKDQQISRQLESRMLDNGPGGEDTPVRYASALAVGYIRSPESERSLKGTSEIPPAAVGIAAAWALKQLEK